MWTQLFVTVQLDFINLKTCFCILEFKFQNSKWKAEKLKIKNERPRV